MGFFDIEDNFSIYKDVPSRLLKGKVPEKKPLVSIVITTTSNRVELFKETLDSALNQQNFTDYEIIIVDDPQDIEKESDTEKLLQAYSDERLLYYKHAQYLDGAGNWNRGIELANGEWFTILHDDDLLFPDFLSEMMAIIAKNSQINMITSRVCTGASLEALTDNTVRPTRLEKVTLGQFFWGGVVPFPGILMKKRLAIELGGYNAKYIPILDSVFWCNYALRYSAWRYTKILAFYRKSEIHGSGRVHHKRLIESWAEYQKELMQVIPAIPWFIKQGLATIGLRSTIRYQKDQCSPEEYAAYWKHYGLQEQYGCLREKYYRLLMRMAWWGWF